MYNNKIYLTEEEKIHLIHVALPSGTDEAMERLNRLNNYENQRLLRMFEGLTKDDIAKKFAGTEIEF